MLAGGKVGVHSYSHLAECSVRVFFLGLVGDQVNIMRWLREIRVYHRRLTYSDTSKRAYNRSEVKTGSLLGWETMNPARAWLFGVYSAELR